MVLIDTEYVRAVVHNVGHRARCGVASKVRALKLAHSQARLRSYSQACERASYIDGRCEYYPSLDVASSSRNSEMLNSGFFDGYSWNTPNIQSQSSSDVTAKTELRRLMTETSEDPIHKEDSETLRRLIMWQEFRDAGVDVNTTQPGYGYGIEAKVEPFPQKLQNYESIHLETRRSSCPVCPLITWQKFNKY